MFNKVLFMKILRAGSRRSRQIPGTQNSRMEIPSLEEEPKWMKLSTTSPAGGQVPAGGKLTSNPAVLLNAIDNWAH